MSFSIVMFFLFLYRNTPFQLEALSAVVKEALEVRMELVAMGLELLEKMARSPRVVARLPAVSATEPSCRQLSEYGRFFCCVPHEHQCHLGCRCK